MIVYRLVLNCAQWLRLLLRFRFSRARFSVDRLIKNSIICWNYLYLTRQLEKTGDEEARENLRHLIGSHSPISWAHIKLRRNYTGPMFLFHLIFFIAFLATYAGKAMLWVLVNHSQISLRETQAHLQNFPAGESLTQISPCFQEVCEDYAVWQVLIGIDKGWQFWSLAIALILYNIGRGFLTRQVGLLRDAEERSDHTPLMKDYRNRFGGYYWLYYLHRWFMQPLMWIGIAALLVHAYDILFNTTVLLPVK